MPSTAHRTKIEKPSMLTGPEATAAPPAGWPPERTIAAAIPRIATSQPCRSPTNAPPR